MKVLVTGSRNFKDRIAIRRELSKLPHDTIVVHGGNGYYDKNGKLISGADMFADEEARRLGFEVRSYPISAETWRTQGRSSGPIRNRFMVHSEHPDKNGVPIQFALAFSTFFTRDFAPGTFDCISVLEARGIKVAKYSE